MKIRLWGTRGSLPAAGPSTVRYGGNTACVEVGLADGSQIILDAGTGLRALGATQGRCRATILLTHYHWDHIQGLPFFDPAYDPANSIRILGPEFEGAGPERYLANQMVPPHFPADLSDMSACREFGVMQSAPLTIGTATVTATQVCHPSVTLGYRIEESGHALVYISDNEVDLATPEQLDGMIQLAAGADVLLHDCQYLESEYAEKRGWGHSTPRQAVSLACRAGVRQLIVFHHDPAHSDEQVDMLADEARQCAGSLPVTIACEGDVLDVGEPVATVGAADSDTDRYSS